MHPRRPQRSSEPSLLPPSLLVFFSVQPSFTLDFVLQTPHGRPVQACWPVEIVQAVADALDMELGPLPQLTPQAANVAA